MPDGTSRTATSGSSRTSPPELAAARRRHRVAPEPGRRRRSRSITFNVAALLDRRPRLHERPPRRDAVGRLRQRAGPASVADAARAARAAQLLAPGPQLGPRAPAIACLCDLAAFLQRAQHPVPARPCQGGHLLGAPVRRRGRRRCGHPTDAANIERLIAPAGISRRADVRPVRRSRLAPRRPRHNARPPRASTPRRPAEHPHQRCGPVLAATWA